ncbi:terminase small subunit [Providencia rettgeri]|nr:terminase small subunit [Providencia rettgeri]
MALTDKLEMFCREYLVDLDATQSPISAEYNDKSARSRANSLYNQKKAEVERLAKIDAERLAEDEAKRIAEEVERVA